MDAILEALEHHPERFLGAAVGVYALAHALLMLPVYFALRKVPAEFRQAAPASVFLMALPCVNLIPLWILFPFRIPASFQRYLEGRHGVEAGAPEGVAGQAADCGQGLGMACAVLWTLSVIPYAGACTGLAGLVVYGFYAARLHEVARIIREGDDGSRRETLPGPPGGRFPRRFPG